MWPPEALEFLRELEANNDRDWFKANRARYDRYLAEPAHTLAEQLAHLGEPHYFRPYANVRFRKGPPIKENVAFTLGGHYAVGYYVNLSLDGLRLGAGKYNPAAEELARFRDAYDATFEAAVASAEAGGLQLIEPTLKRAPRGYPQDHPHLDRLRLKHVVVHTRHELAPWLHTPECDERIRAELESARPLVAWLNETLA